MKETMVRPNVRLPESLHRKAKATASALGLSLMEFIELAIVIAVSKPTINNKPGVIITGAK